MSVSRQVRALLFHFPVQASEEEGEGRELKPAVDGTATAASRRIGSCAQSADKTRRRDSVQC